jgi:hypothetical protein
MISDYVKSAWNYSFVLSCLLGYTAVEAVRTSETSVDNHFTRQYIPEDNSEHHSRRRENLKSHNYSFVPHYVYMNRSSVYLNTGID